MYSAAVILHACFAHLRPVTAFPTYLILLSQALQCLRIDAFPFFMSSIIFSYPAKARLFIMNIFLLTLRECAAVLCYLGTEMQGFVHYYENTLESQPFSINIPQIEFFSTSPGSPANIIYPFYYCQTKFSRRLICHFYYYLKKQNQTSSKFCGEHKKYLSGSPESFE